MKTIKLPHFEILAKGERGRADNDIFNINEASGFLESLVREWRHPTWNEWHYLLNLFSYGVFMKKIIPDNPDVFIWTEWQEGGKNVDYYKNGIWEFDEYWWPKRNTHYLAMEPYNRTLKPDLCPWIDMYDIVYADKNFFILPVRSI